jgi:hypothetical protein
MTKGVVSDFIYWKELKIFEKQKKSLYLII